MKALDFVEKIKKIQVNIEALKKQNLSDNLINQLLNRYNISLKKGKMYKEGDPVIDLVEFFDVTPLEIGMISFNEKIITSEKFIYFGKFEIDDLVINTTFMDILYIEEGTSHVMYNCAQNSSKFLDAILFAAYFLEKHAEDDNLVEDQLILSKMANECADLAGGESYLPFYQLLLGCDIID